MDDPTQARGANLTGAKPDKQAATVWKIAGGDVQNSQAPRLIFILLIGWNNSSRAASAMNKKNVHP
ncbi:MAG: hypothetical protein NTX56_09620 [Proteobacteria bacterium]|nr:hypothetical protein [Pseudomonadota bacterium]